jgi:UDP-N-acetylglucosamine transferase subunit ALG13
VIFVTVGTHEQPMQRLMAAIALLPRLLPDHGRYVVQHGYSTPPDQWEAHAFLAPAALSALMMESDIIVCHGGPATIAEARALGKIPVVVPRSRRYGEHVDDHQVAYARRLAREGEIILVEETGQLADVIGRYSELSASLPRPTALDPTEAIERFSRLAEGLLSRCISA